MVLFISGSGQPLPKAECALGLDSNQMGPQQSYPGGPHRGNAPLGMINEPADSRHAAQMLWGVGVHGVEKGVFSPIPGSCHGGTSPPPVPDNSLAFPEPRRKRAGEMAL